MESMGIGGLDGILGRFMNQEERIYQGIGSGSLNPMESQFLQMGELGLVGNLMQDMSDGQLSPQELQQLNGEANMLSTDIYDLKHDCPLGTPIPTHHPCGGNGCGNPTPVGGNGCPGGGGFPPPWPPIGNGGNPIQPWGPVYNQGAVPL